MNHGHTRDTRPQRSFSKTPSTNTRGLRFIPENSVNLYDLWRTVVKFANKNRILIIGIMKTRFALFVNFNSESDAFWICENFDRNYPLKSITQINSNLPEIDSNKTLQLMIRFDILSGEDFNNRCDHIFHWISEYAQQENAIIVPPKYCDVIIDHNKANGYSLFLYLSSRNDQINLERRFVADGTFSSVTYVKFPLQKRSSVRHDEPDVH